MSTDQRVYSAMSYCSCYPISRSLVHKNISSLGCRVTLITQSMKYEDHVAAAAAAASAAAVKSRGYVTSFGAANNDSV